MYRVLLFLTLMLYYCCAWAQSGPEHTVTINRQSFGAYPAVLFDFKNNKITRLARDFREEDFAGDADLWIEPRDPEINCLERTEDTRLKGVTPHIALAEVTYDELDDKTMPAQIDKTDLARNLIKAGTVFVLQASNNVRYKVRIDRADKETETFVFTYRLLK